MSYAVCVVAAAPVRKAPDHRSEMTSQLLFGELVFIAEEHNEWLKVRCVYDGYEGWTTHHLVSFVAEQLAVAATNFVTTGLVNKIRFKDQRFQIPMGCSLTGFTENSRRLWDADLVYEGAYRNSQEPLTQELFQNTIQPWLRTPYLWGGKTFLGVDCSGFVQTVFKVLGVPLLRDAYQQAEQGAPVVLDASKESDLAFFKNETGRITHVGIILDNFKIIHASGFVRIDNLTSEGIITPAGKQTHHLHSIKRVLDFNA